MTTGREDVNRRMLRARDLMDRSYAEPLDVPALARAAHVSPAHFSRTFRETFGETPHRYLQRRRVERAMYLLRETGTSVTEICLRVGFSSLGTFSTTFRAVVGRLTVAVPALGRAARGIGAGLLLPVVDAPEFLTRTAVSEKPGAADAP